MTHHQYVAGRQIEAACYEHDWPFHGLIQAAMRRADSGNLSKLKAAFPDQWDDLRARYDAPGGLLPGEEPADAQ